MLQEMEINKALKKFTDGKNIMAVIPVKGKAERYRMVPVG